MDSAEEDCQRCTILKILVEKLLFTGPGSDAAGQDSESCAVSPHLERISSSGASQSTEDRAFRNPQEEAEALDRAKQVLLGADSTAATLVSIADWSK